MFWEADGSISVWGEKGLFGPGDGQRISVDGGLLTGMVIGLVLMGGVSERPGSLFTMLRSMGMANWSS